MKRGTLILVGVGPGDPELITLKALKTLQKSPLIAYPVGAKSGESLARKIATPHIPKTAEEYGFAVPMNVERAPAMAAYDEAARVLSDHLDKGRDVALLCEGDPLFYGSAMYLLERLQERYRVEIIPGISSLTACAAVSNWPLAARNERLKVLPAPLSEEVLIEELQATEAAAILKIGRHFAKVRHVLNALDLMSKSVIIESATTGAETVRPLSAVRAEEKPYFSTILVYCGEEKWGKKR